MSKCDKENDKPNAMDVYKFLWRGRDIELSHIWHRSVFLGAFLLGIASVYSIYFKDVFLKQFEIDNQVVKTSSQNDKYNLQGLCDTQENLSTMKSESNLRNERSKIFVFGVVPIMITIIGIIFSQLWIMMAKGSKAWHDVYDNSIGKVSAISAFWNDESIKEIYGECFNNKFIFGRLDLDKSTKLDKCLFSTEGGRFSVSKINIMIGIVFLVMFIVLLLGHTMWTVCLVDMCKKLETLDSVLLLFLSVILFSVCPICWLITKMVKSSYLEDL